MKNDNDKKIVGLLVLVAVITVISMIASFGGNGVDENQLKSEIISGVLENIPEQQDPQVNVDTSAIADEVAMKIKGTAATVEEEPKLSQNDKVDDLWENMYSEEIEELEAEAEAVALAELEEDYHEVLEDFLKENIEGFDELEDVDVKDTEVVITSLGLKEDEDKVADVTFELKIKYTLEEGVAEEFKKKIIATANVFFEEGDFDEEEVEFSFE